MTPCLLPNIQLGQPWNLSILKAIYYMGDKKTIDEANLGIPKLAKVVLKKKIKGTFIEELVTESKLL